MTCAVRGWSVRKSRRPRTKIWTRRRVLTLAAVGEADEAGVHDYDGTRRLISHGWTSSVDNLGCVHSAPVPRELSEWINTYLPEGCEQQGKLVRLCRSMHGMRDAASIWGGAWSEVLKEGALYSFLPSRRKFQRIVAWRRHLCGSTTGAVANLGEPRLGTLGFLQK